MWSAIYLGPVETMSANSESHHQSSFLWLSGKSFSDQEQFLCISSYNFNQGLADLY